MTNTQKTCLFLRNGVTGVSELDDIEAIQRIHPPCPGCSWRKLPGSYESRLRRARLEVG